eukprot:CAMPEP_0115097894 /NCGR_PEP_ID=MMETSP0227-20121206/30795_1 /TAXON_ID=89957 /ORGANISM="Polarella glacialis, Strain CCMP 1383" /LENGTH=418 /DNA_ID=CAMNT_0002492315 /DNA_START=43 /DNA_END=1299 /DNA_ORIENTATION=+
MQAWQSNEGSIAVKLHKRETSATGYWGHPGICTVTFCEGDAHRAFAALKPRLRKVLDANPWIAGQLDAKKMLVHPKTGSDELVDEILFLQKCAKVVRSTVYPELVKATGANAALTVQKGSKLQKSAGRVTKLVVVEPEQPGGEFALVFSMSHVAADGHDYYRIYNMIAGTGAVQSMSASRIPEYEERDSEWTGKRDFAWLSGGGLIKGMLAGALFGPKASWCCYFVDQEKVVEQKKTAAASGVPGVSYVSTNDVLTSHFCNAAAARVCMMVINMRNKIPLEINDSSAGCYEGCLLLDAANYADPAHIRMCLNAGAPFTRQTPSPALPGLCGSCPMAFITSWASFDFELSLEGAVSRQVLHLPCMAMPDMMDVAVVFKPQPGKLGVLYLAKRAKPEKLRGQFGGTILGASIDDGIFPPR